MVRRGLCAIGCGRVASRASQKKWRRGVGVGPAGRSLRGEARGGARRWAVVRGCHWSYQCGIAPVIRPTTHSSRQAHYAYARHQGTPAHLSHTPSARRSPSPPQLQPFRLQYRCPCPHRWASSPSLSCRRHTASEGSRRRAAQMSATGKYAEARPGRVPLRWPSAVEDCRRVGRGGRRAAMTCARRWAGVSIGLSPRICAAISSSRHVALSGARSFPSSIPASHAFPEGRTRPLTILTPFTLACPSARLHSSFVCLLPFLCFLPAHPRPVASPHALLAPHPQALPHSPPLALTLAHSQDSIACIPTMQQ